MIGAAALVFYLGACTRSPRRFDSHKNAGDKSSYDAAATRVVATRRYAGRCLQAVAREALWRASDRRGSLRITAWLAVPFARVEPLLDGVDHHCRERDLLVERVLAHALMKIDWQMNRSLAEAISISARCTMAPFFHAPIH